MEIIRKKSAKQAIRKNGTSDPEDVKRKIVGGIQDCLLTSVSRSADQETQMHRPDNRFEPYFQALSQLIIIPLLRQRGVVYL